MEPEKPAPSPLVLSYLSLRKAIGIIGIALPFVLVVGKMLLDGPGIQNSISDYYYTSMGNVFVGSLCAIGVFMLSYRGPDSIDRMTGNFACLFAVGVALFPTEPATVTNSHEVLVGRVHLAFAASLFLTLAFFCLVLFRKTNPNGSMTNQKKKRNIVYAVCGCTILGCILMIVVYYLFMQNSGLGRLDPVFWLESTAVVAFGISWLTKGEAILSDE